MLYMNYSSYPNYVIYNVIQVQEINPKCESVKTSDYMMLTYKIKK